jgi:hypothetical protein
VPGAGKFKIAIAELYLAGTYRASRLFRWRSAWHGACRHNTLPQDSRPVGLEAQLPNRALMGYYRLASFTAHNTTT